MPKLTINGQEIEVEQGTSIIQAAEMLGIEIPRFCYHDRLNVPANCRMCLVEVKGGPPKPQAACALACSDGMEVETDSEMVHKARKGVMEFLLINHPLDCPICDQGGECDLQDQAVAYGFDRSRYHENKRAVKNKDIGPLIKTIMTRCIHCTRCVRFGEEIAGVSELGLLNRGEDVEIGTFIDKAVSTELSGNMIDICPVGALTNKPYAFKARPWELTKTESIDVMDAVGSNIRVDSRNGAVIRVLPRLHEDINEEWINDRTRFACDGLSKQRLDRPFVRDQETGKLRPSSWEEALSLAADKIKQTKPDKIAAMSGDLADVESIVTLKDMLDGFGVKNYDCRSDESFFDSSERCGYIMNTGIAGIEEADAVLLVGTFPRWEGTMVNARIRKTWLNNRIPIAAIGEDHDHSYPVTHIGNSPKDLDDLISGKSDFSKVLKDANRPLIIAGQGVFQRDDGKGLHAKLHKLAETFDVVTDEWNGFNVLQTGAGRVGALDVGFVNDRFDISNVDLVYLLNVDEPVIDKIPENSFVIYQGHHGDKGAMRADIIFPGATYTEKNGIYVNTEGRAQSTRMAVHPPGEAREDWKILRALSEKIDISLSYKTIIQLRQRIGDQWPHLTQFDTVNAAKWSKFGDPSVNIEANKEFASPLDNFYITNVVTRASETMAKCQETFSNQDETRLEAAE